MMLRAVVPCKHSFCAACDAMTPDQVKQRRTELEKQRRQHGKQEQLRRDLQAQQAEARRRAAQEEAQASILRQTSVCIQRHERTFGCARCA